MCVRKLTGLFVLTLLLVQASPLLARDAAFMEPGNAPGAGAGGDAVTVEPKSEIDIGETAINIARRTTLFFVNQSTQPIEVLGLVVNGDSSVTTAITNDDCSKQGKIGPSSRCSVEVSVTPTVPGPWGAEILMTHKGSGRLARAKLTGKATGPSNADKKDSGLTMSSKDASIIDFATVEIGSGKAVRSALMVNDSQETITINAINVIAAENGLERLDQGCSVDMDLKPNESCPVTLMWSPVTKGVISTDLIIRHSGRLGFVVIPVRGIAKENEAMAAKNSKNGKDDAGLPPSTFGKDSKFPLPPTADELEKLTNFPPVAADTLATATKPVKATAAEKAAPEKKEEENPIFHLIGTVGNRAVLLKPDGTTAVVDIGEDIPWGDDHIAKITSVTPKTAKIFINGKESTLQLEAARELTSRAAQRAQAEDAKNSSNKADKANRPTGAPKPDNGSARGQ